ncbi:MAG: methyl-accepting chemotaxis protein [Nitrospirota bacterium]
MLMTDDSSLKTNDIQRRNDEYVGYLQNIGKTLEKLIKFTEDDFLTIGKRLNDFSIKAGEISKLSESAANLMSGDEIGKSIDHLKGLLGRMSDFLYRSEDKSEQSSKTLLHMQKIVGDIREILNGFKKIVKKLGMLGISTKIESARLGKAEAGFNVLADDVEKLSVLINSKSKNIMSQSDSLNAMIRKTLLKRTSLKEKQEGKSLIVFENIRKRLTSLIEMKEKSSSISKNVANHSEQIFQEINEIVVSIQFHDITRQQIEGVKRALENISKEKGSFGFFELQKKQLCSARDEMLNAMNNIIEHLSGVSCSVNELSEEAGEIVGYTGKTDSSSLYDIEKGMSAITLFLSENAEVSRELAGEMSSVADMVGKMSIFVSDIENIASEIELIALNSLVKAAHTGDEGAPLGVLAEAIQRLSVDARSQTNSVSDVLKKITSTAEKLCVSIDSEFEGIDDEIGSIEKDLSALINSIHEMNENIIPILMRMDEISQALAEGIDKTISGTTVHKKVASVIDDVVTELNEMMSKYHDLFSASGESGSTGKLTELEDSYVASAVPGRSGSDHFQDNVELF